ncbi:MAG: hypothetical protein GQ570_03685 [Helicobacteraceae bacterium]|nr:hypothetical protein [Helicobacteraceae bacterium]
MDTDTTTKVKTNPDVDLQSWVMIIRDIPVADEHKPLVLGIYLARPRKYFFEYELTNQGYYYHTDYQEFIASYKTSRGHRDKKLFLNRHSALRSAYRYMVGDRSKLDEGIEEYLDELNEKGLLPKIEPQMTIFSENGEVDVQRHEYALIDKERLAEYRSFIGKEYSVSFFDGKEEGNKDFDDKMFYLRTRGLDQNKAIELMMGDITSQQVCYLKPHPELASSMGMV